MLPLPVFSRERHDHNLGVQKGLFLNNLVLRSHFDVAAHRFFWGAA